jgi:hypothetical protein
MLSAEHNGEQLDQDAAKAEGISTVGVPSRFGAYVAGDRPDEDPDKRPLPPELAVPTGEIWSWTALLALVSLMLLNVLMGIWPDTGPAKSDPSVVTVLWGALKMELTSSARMLLIATLTGALGSMLHTMTSFADYAGNRRLGRSWMPWYILRPFIGTALALLFYLILRTGLLTAQTAPTDVNPYGIAAIAGLAGMFSKQATDKLNETFTTLFGVKKGGDQDRLEKLAKDAPRTPQSLTGDKTSGKPT